MLLVDASKIIILNVLKIQIVIAPLVAILFCFYPEFGKGMKGDRIVVRMYNTDQFNKCQLPYGVRNGIQPFFHCTVNGKRQTFELMNKGGFIYVWDEFIQLYARSDSTEDTMKLKISTTDCSTIVKMGTSAVSNASLPVLTDDCSSVQNVIITVWPNVDGCWISEISSKPQLSGELFPVEMFNVVLVNVGSVVTFDCGDNKQQRSKCIKEGNRGKISPDIPNDCPTPKQDTTSTTTTSTTEMTTDKSYTIKSTRSQRRSTTMKLKSGTAKTKDDETWNDPTEGAKRKTSRSSGTSAGEQSLLQWSSLLLFVLHLTWAILEFNGVL